MPCLLSTRPYRKDAESKNRPAAISDKINRRINQSQKIRAGDNHESVKRAKILRAIIFIDYCMLHCDLSLVTHHLSVS